MTDALLQTLTDYGALGVFAAFLAYQYVSLQKRMDGLVDKFQEQLDKINADYDVRIEKMRDRYSVVIDKYDNERRILTETLTRSVEDTSAKVVQVQAKLDELLHEIRQH
jgi:hypothetical protein